MTLAVIGQKLQLRASSPSLLAVGGQLNLKSHPQGWLANSPFFSWGDQALDDAVQVFVYPPGKRSLGDFACEIPTAEIRSRDSGPGHPGITFNITNNIISILPATNAGGASISTVADVVDAINIYDWTQLGFPAGHGIVARLGDCAGAAIFPSANALLATVVPGSGTEPIVEVDSEVCTIDWAADVDMDSKPDVIFDWIYPTYTGASLPPPGALLVGVTITDGVGQKSTVILPVT